MAFTSSLPAEGKSLVSALLAKTLSEMGQRVLLVDADMRKPQIHHRLGLNNILGLSNLLTNDAMHWQDMLQTVEGYDNWSVITAGLRPPDPTRLLSSHRMHQLVAELTSSGRFDLVLFDTPPVLGLADAALVAEHCDGLMLLVNLGRVDRGLPREAIQRIRSSGAPLLGIVTNSIQASQQSYGYGYGYGYAAYDTSATYAYYAEEGDVEEPFKEAKATSTLRQRRSHQADAKQQQGWRQWLSTMQHRQRQFLRWLDR